MAEVILPGLGTLPLGRCTVCDREVLKRSMMSSRTTPTSRMRCSRCFGVGTTRGRGDRLRALLGGACT